MRRTLIRTVTAAAMALALLPSLSAEAGPSGGALPSSLIQVITVAGLHGVPVDAEMVAATVTAVGTAADGHMTVFACDEAPPKTSNLNYVADGATPNLVFSRVSADGTICVSTLALSDVVVDLVGYVPAGSGITPLASPVRFLDSRNGDPALTPAGATTTVPVRGVHGVDASAEVVFFNLTAVRPRAAGHFTAYPCGTKAPDTSSINYVAQQTVANLVISRIGDNGAVCIDNLTAAEMVVDVAAYSTSGITPLASPVRMIDTRDVGQPIAAKTSLRLDVGARADVPSTATAAVYNLTSAQALARGHATSYPCDVAVPKVSNLNYIAGRPVANGTITKLSDAGEICIYSEATSHFVVDLVGYVEGVADYVPLTPVRIIDTREGWRRTCDWLIVENGAFSGETRLRVMNVVTGEIINPAGAMRTGSGETVVNENCDGVLSLGNGVTEIMFSGDIRTIPLPEPLQNSLLMGVHSLDGIPVVSDEGGGLYDAATGEQLWGGQSELLNRFDLSPNGIAVMTYDNFEGFDVPAKLAIWDIRNSTLLFEGPLQDSFAPISISPDGTYVAFSVGQDSATGADGGLAIVTLFGDVVDFLPAPVALHPYFNGTGSVVVCADFNGVYDFDLYGPLTQLLDWGQVASATGNEFCGFRS